jgi:WD40 repeat protein
VATGAEDTTLRIWKRGCSGDDAMECVAVVQGHSAGIQALRWDEGQQYLLSSAGSEELFVWRVGGVNSSGYEALAVVREAVWGDKTRDGDLRIVDFDVAAWGEGKMLVTMGLSDSSVRSYVYSTAGADGEGGSFTLLATGRYTGACPTQVRHLQVDGETGEVHVLTAFTDGHVAVWRTEGKSSEFGLMLVVKIHQSSTKSLDVSPPDDDLVWRVVTGGDDNALGFLDLSWDGDKRIYTVLGRYRVKDAHAAAVTGLCIVKQQPGLTEVATASNDQRVKLWRAERNGTAGIRVSMLDNRYSAVADAGDLELIAPGKLMVGGVGMEVWNVSGGRIEES